MRVFRFHNNAAPRSLSSELRSENQNLEYSAGRVGQAGGCLDGVSLRPSPGLVSRVTSLIKTAPQTVQVIRAFVLASRQHEFIVFTFVNSVP
ncbi:hypothetical protein RRG08_010396 [Elysia crispata]|uniref:Uncharacterized protein n=1 Tax=Elysia crispata TaxID=231223 RepID=A0AAE1BAM6_9GAST|nr:hypothetical protein RRG08_010396 [Elysia crispata]